MKITTSIELSKGYEHWRGMFLANKAINIKSYKLRSK